MNLDQPVENLRFVGKETARHLKKLGIQTIEDLLFHFPFRYLDLSKIKKIGELKLGEEVTVVGIVREVRKIVARRRLKIVKVQIFDGTGYLAGIWFNQEYMENVFKSGMEVAFSGTVNMKFGELQIENPFYDIIRQSTEETVHTGRIIPVHPSTAKVSTTRLRRLISEALKVSQVPEVLPKKIRDKFNLPEKQKSLNEIHFPTSFDVLEKVRHRFIFEELFLLQTALALVRKKQSKINKGYKYIVGGPLLKKFLQNLPFEFTEDQKKALSEIKQDLLSSRPMNRLLQGEVGSGKTLVAATAILIAVDSQMQAALMAPTEVLAEQHYRNFLKLYDGLPIKVALLTSNTPKGERKEILDGLKKGEVNLLIGTHALIQEDVNFKNLSLVVIDEQHRFGLGQRIKLKEKGFTPDVLIMTATPIPRTLALTFYGDLDVSIMKTLPLGRDITSHIQTIVCDKEHRKAAYLKIREEIKKGHQAYIICPLIEESDKLEAKAVMEEANHLRTEVFPDLKVGILHGKLKPKEKEEIMNAFRQGELDILISTTVIEVGIDVPNATVMLIENADRFGLSQLHQLRGRIGRGAHRSYCILFADPTTEEGKARLKAIKENKDGFSLAEADLKIRGEGEIFGLRQAGLPDLKIAKLVRDLPILEKARQVAFELVESDNFSLKDYPELMNELKKRFAQRLSWLFHG